MVERDQSTQSLSTDHSQTVLLSVKTSSHQPKPNCPLNTRYITAEDEIKGDQAAGVQSRLGLCVHSLLNRWPDGQHTLQPTLRKDNPTLGIDL